MHQLHVVAAEERNETRRSIEVVKQAGSLGTNLEFQPSRDGFAPDQRQPHMDILAALRLDDNVSWYENDGSPAPAWTPHLVFALVADSVRSVYAADINSDGLMDVLSASKGNILPEFRLQLIIKYFIINRLFTNL